jgi:hypothetical protein
VDGKQLRALFQQFNAQYFNGRLPAYALRAVEQSTWLGESGTCFRKRRLIKVSRTLPDEEAISTLLHEMAHAATNGGHGMPWEREMIRLREAGAPLVSPDLDVDLGDWYGHRVSRTRFRGETEDMLVACELNATELVLNDAVKNFIRNVGGAETVAEFRRKYPWAGAVFNDVRKDHLEYQDQRAKLSAKLAQQKNDNRT